jgi:hypothetical protein
MTKWILAGALAIAVSGASAEEPKKVKRTPKAATSGQMICNQGGCRPVAPGCHLETGGRYSSSNSERDREVCK